MYKKESQDKRSKTITLTLQKWLSKWMLLYALYIILLMAVYEVDAVLRLKDSKNRRISRKQ